MAVEANIHVWNFGHKHVGGIPLKSLNPLPFPDLPITHAGFLNSLKEKIVEVPHFQTSRTCMPWPLKLHQNQKSMWTCQRRDMGALKQRPRSPISGEWDGTFFESVDLFGVDPVDPWSFLVFDDFVDLSLCRFHGNLFAKVDFGVQCIRFWRCSKTTRGGCTNSSRQQQ